jgi:nucleoside-diphosphate-sugar epimerase
MAVMVTGIGHVGSYLVRDLVRAGEDVVLFGLFGGAVADASHTPDLHVLEQVVGPDYADQMEIVVGDVTDFDALVETAKKFGVTKVVHLASLLSSAAEASPYKTMMVNCVGTANVFEMASCLDFDKVVWASSIDVFGEKSLDADGVIHDDSPYDPPFLYGGTKVMGEYLARSYGDHKGLSLTGMRLSRIYGYGEHIKAGRGGGSSWLSALLRNPALGVDEEVVVPFGGRMMDFLYLEDAADAFTKALNDTRPGSHNYLITGTHRQVSEVYEFVRLLFPEAPVRLEMEDAPLPPGSGMVWRYHFDGSGAAGDLGYRGRYTLEEGLLRTINANRASAGLEPVEMPASVKSTLSEQA